MGIPGEQFSYCSGCSHLLTAVLEESTESGVLPFAREVLFEPLGITNWTWEEDAKGLPIGGWGLRLTPRDMARFGYLFLRQGQWDGRQVVSAEWVSRATRRHVSTDGELGYGYQWWIDADGKGFAALGRNGQMIYVRPDADLIVVTTAGGVDHAEIYRLIETYVLPAVITPP
jgi:CubicO group peptidase (beta-lactamase class C family)